MTRRRRRLWIAFGVVLFLAISFELARWLTLENLERTRILALLTAEARGQGHGRTLYRSLLDACVLRGFHSAVGGITLPNPASVRLHESLGFVAVGVFKAAGSKFDRWHDVGFWQRML